LKKVVDRERNKNYYRVLHVPIWIWVFFILPGDLTSSLFNRGADQRHWIWLLIVAMICGWRGYAGRLPGVETAPYITHFGVHQPNLWYRVVCYTAAWIVLLVPFTLNLIGMVIAAFTQEWIITDLYRWLYYPLLMAVVTGAAFNLVPRAKRSTLHEGAERAWFYVAAWTVVPAQLVGWATWRLGKHFEIGAAELAYFRLLTYIGVTVIFFTLAYLGKLGRTDRYDARKELAVAAAE
jgi:hypothetical protein